MAPSANASGCAACPPCSYSARRATSASRRPDTPAKSGCACGSGWRAFEVTCRMVKRPVNAMPSPMMNTMEIAAFGGPEMLRPCRRRTPEPAAGEVLIRVAAAGVNRPDVMQRKGLYPPPPGASDIPGLEVAGEVVAVGRGVAEPELGDRVCALVTGGGYA